MCNGNFITWPYWNERFYSQPLCTHGGSWLPRPLTKLFFNFDTITGKMRNLMEQNSGNCIQTFYDICYKNILTTPPFLIVNHCASSMCSASLILIINKFLVKWNINPYFTSTLSTTVYSWWPRPLTKLFLCPCHRHRQCAVHPRSNGTDVSSFDPISHSGQFFQISSRNQGKIVTVAAVIFFEIVSNTIHSLKNLILTW